MYLQSCRADDYDDRRRDHQETPDDQLKAAIIKLGEVDPSEELGRLEIRIREHIPRNIPLLSEAFRISVTEQPFKIPYYATLLRQLHNKSDNPTEEETPIGRLILEDFWRGFQGYVDQTAWREARLCIHFLRIYSCQVDICRFNVALLRSFTAVLDEFGVSNGRAKRACLCAGEGWPILKSILDVSRRIITAIQAYIDSTAPKNGLLRLYQCFIQTASLKRTLSRPYAIYPPFDPSVLQPYVLPSVLVPPEAIEMDTLSPDTSGEETQVKKMSGPNSSLAFSQASFA
ncbi:hypothetical protein D9611_002854 [Ephemerocybe angulata]|uniref:Uncharacterized protein n=1 Tax=Ephemerocybe angulata TaxID=980116 RepID=A0A8H5C8S7_9AGAR|nr:hypothetical protein D9611_002854 [Tulosesus angulatus]